MMLLGVKRFPRGTVDRHFPLFRKLNWLSVRPRGDSVWRLYSRTWRFISSSSARGGAAWSSPLHFTLLSGRLQLNGARHERMTQFVSSRPLFRSVCLFYRLHKPSALSRWTLTCSVNVRDGAFNGSSAVPRRSSGISQEEISNTLRWLVIRLWTALVFAVQQNETHSRSRNGGIESNQSGTFGGFSENSSCENHSARTDCSL